MAKRSKLKYYFVKKNTFFNKICYFLFLFFENEKGNTFFWSWFCSVYYSFIASKCRRFSCFRMCYGRFATIKEFWVFLKKCAWISLQSCRLVIYFSCLLSLHSQVFVKKYFCFVKVRQSGCRPCCGWKITAQMFLAFKIHPEIISIWTFQNNYSMLGLRDWNVQLVMILIQFTMKVFFNFTFVSFLKKYLFFYRWWWVWG